MQRVGSAGRSRRGSDNPRSVNYMGLHLPAPVLFLHVFSVPLRLQSVSSSSGRGKDHRGGAVVFIGQALDTLTRHYGGLVPGTEEDDTARDSLVGPEKRRRGGGSRFGFTRGTDDHVALIDLLYLSA
jgi:hypothetical protein